MDCLTLTLEPEDSMQGTRRSIEIAERLKAATGAAVGV
jgi:hypothetical protein